MHIAVKTAISLPVARPPSTSFGTRPMAAPAAPRAVIGTEIPSAEVKPNRGERMNSAFSASQGRNPMPLISCASKSAVVRRTVGQHHDHSTDDEYAGDDRGAHDDAVLTAFQHGLYKSAAYAADSDDALVEGDTAADIFCRGGSFCPIEFFSSSEASDAH